MRRLSIEQCFEECKYDLGMDHYEGRSWTGWHRHIQIVFVAHLFLMILRKKFSADFSQLSEDGQILVTEANIDRSENVLILTLDNVHEIIQSLFSGAVDDFKNAVKAIDYRLRRYAISFY